MLRVGQVMSRLSIYLYNYHTIGDAITLMMEKKVTGLPLMNEQGHLLGMVTKDQIIEKGLEDFSAENKAADYLTTRFLPLNEEASLEDVWNLSFDIYPVFNNQEEITGVVSKYDILLAYFQEVQGRICELEAVFDSVHNGILAINKQGIITSLNPAAEKPTRSTKEGAAGRFLMDVIQPTGLLEVVRSGIPEFGVIFQVGSRQYITNRTPIIKNGEVVGAVGVFQDAAEFEKVLPDLQSVKNLQGEVRTIVNTSFDGLIICNNQGDILRCNPAAGKMLNVSEEELVGRSFKDFIDKGVFRKNIIYLVKKRDGLVSVLEKPDSEHFWQVTGNPVYDEEGEIRKIVINIRDTSETVHLRETLEETEKLADEYRSELTQLKNNQETDVNLRSRSALMNNVLDLASRVSQVDSPVVLIGERGVGKEEIAKSIHCQSKRSKGPFYKINCGSLPSQLLEIELFGQGPALTDTKAHQGKTGILELANQGSIYLEDIGKMPPDLQGRLVQALHAKTLQALDGEEIVPVDARIMAGADRPLKELVDSGHFRSDLFYSLNVAPIKVPALRERKEDLIPLAFFYLERNNKRYGVKRTLSSEAVRLLLEYPWYGNIRELANVLERLVVTANEEVISAAEVEAVLFEETDNQPRTVTVTRVAPLKEAIADVERQLVALAMKTHGTTVKAAEALGVNQSTVVRKLKKTRDSNGAIVM